MMHKWIIIVSFAMLFELVDIFLFIYVYKYDDMLFCMWALLIYIVSIFIYILFASIVDCLTLGNHVDTMNADIAFYSRKIYQCPVITQHIMLNIVWTKTMSNCGFWGNINGGLCILYIILIAIFNYGNLMVVIFSIDILCCGDFLKHCADNVVNDKNKNKNTNTNTNTNIIKTNNINVGNININKNNIITTDIIIIMDDKVINNNIDIANKTCAICYMAFEDNDIDKINKLKCHHIYHIECINKWFDIKKNCPLCLTHDV